MAEDAQVGQKPITGTRKKIIFIAITALLVVAAGAFVMFFLMGDSQTDAERAAEAEQAAEAERVRSVYYRFAKPFIVSVKGRNRQHHLMVGVTISSKKQEDMDILNKHLPVIRNDLNLVFDDNDLYVLQTDEGRRNLNEQATIVTRSFIEKETGSTSDVQLLFTSFVMQ